MGLSMLNKTSHGGKKQTENKYVFKREQKAGRVVAVVTSVGRLFHVVRVNVNVVYALKQNFSGCFSSLSYKKLSCRKQTACDCPVGQFWPNVTGRRYFADIIGLSSTTPT